MSAPAVDPLLGPPELPAAPVLVVSAGPTDLADVVAEQLRRPVAASDRMVSNGFRVAQSIGVYAGIAGRSQRAGIAVAAENSRPSTGTGTV